MSRRERLTQVMAALDQGTWQRAEDLAAAMGVTPRTIYRDMDTLRAAGVAIEGTRGQGYRATHALTLPPVSLSALELETLFLGLAAVAQLDDSDLTNAALSLTDRLDALLPEDRARPADLTSAGDIEHTNLSHLAGIRAALRTRQKLDITLHGHRHTLRPLKLEHWGRLWRLIGWSESTEAFLTAPLAAISDLRPLPALFVDDPERNLAAFEARS